MKVKVGPLILLVAFFFSGAVIGENVIEDNGVGLSHEELEYLVKYWSPDMQLAAATDLGDRVELLSMALANKRIANKASSLGPASDPDVYWRHIFSIRNLQREYVVSRYMAELSVPDMSELARERYDTEKQRYAFDPETRLTSHILLLCVPGQCDRAARRPEAEKLLEALNNGADFEELVAAYSQDPGSKDKGGKFDRWITLGEANVAARYTGGAFAIGEVGEYSGIVETRFGFHIIRLDGIREAHELPYDEVKEQIIAALQADYRDLAAKEFDARYRLSDNAYVDGDAMEAIFARYQTAATAAPARAQAVDQAEEAEQSAAQ